MLAVVSKLLLRRMPLCHCLRCLQIQMLAMVQTPSKPVLPITEPPVTPQSGRGTNHDETTHKDADFALLPLKSGSGPIHAHGKLGASTVARSSPQDSDDIILPKPTVDADDSAIKTQRSATKKRSRPSPNKRIAKKLVIDEDNGDEDDGGNADDPAKTSSRKGA
ncbi:hypothetical protein C2845_PM05G20000 [Panicum miliaceum]|uniref:Uncharacterized protein n=1 Tax=Panicum miliaceum TaxID=4540 RepID=A0A3L6SZF9_PANMI|nr:hypothetical protein C2845_PM05G20000 [Panicum miliaceum]